MIDATATAPRARTLSFPTQDYISRAHGDARIDCYVTEPAVGIGPATGLLLLIHGWGNDGFRAYRDEAVAFADRFDLVVTRVEYRDSGREAHHPAPGRTFDVPYDFSKLQTIDALRAAKATLDAYPSLNRRRLLLWGGSQGAHIAAQCLVFAPTVWAGAILCCGLYHPYTSAEQVADLYGWELLHYPGIGFVEYALGPGQVFPPAEVEIRSPRRNAALVPSGVPIALIHGTRDDNCDVRHAVEFYARLLAHGKQASFYAISGGDHGLGGAENPDENTRLKATLKYAAGMLDCARRPDTVAGPTGPTEIACTGGRYEVRSGEDGPLLTWIPIA